MEEEGFQQYLNTLKDEPSSENMNNSFNSQGFNPRSRDNTIYEFGAETDQKTYSGKSRDSQFIFDFDKEMELGLQMMNEQSRRFLNTQQKTLLNKDLSPKAEKQMISTPTSHSKLEFSLYKSQKTLSQQDTDKQRQERTYAFSEGGVSANKGSTIFGPGSVKKQARNGTPEEKFFFGKKKIGSVAKVGDKIDYDRPKKSIVGAITEEKTQGKKNSQFAILETEIKSKQISSRSQEL